MGLIETERSEEESGDSGGEDSDDDSDCEDDDGGREDTEEDVEGKKPKRRGAADGNENVRKKRRTGRGKRRVNVDAGKVSDKKQKQFESLIESEMFSAEEKNEKMESQGRGEDQEIRKVPGFTHGEEDREDGRQGENHCSKLTKWEKAERSSSAICNGGKWKGFRKEVVKGAQVQ